MLHLYTMPLFSTCIPGRHAPGRTISLKNYSYQVLLYSYRRSTPFLELLQQQRSCLLKLYTEAVIKSQLKHFAPSSSSPTVPWVYNSPLCENEKKKKKVWGSKAGVASPLMISEMEHLGSEARYLTPRVSLQGQNLKDTSQDLVCVKARLHQHKSLYPAFFFPPFPQNRKHVI